MRREDIREQTMQLIFQMDVAKDFDYSKLSVLEENSKILTKKQAITTLEAVRDHIEDIDAMISSNIDNWNFDRIAKVDLAVLRTAVAEILYVDDIPLSVSINEAVNLSKKFGDDKSYAFVNSVLSKISKNNANNAK
jgi:transcription antitermination protein NusB